MGNQGRGQFLKRALMMAWAMLTLFLVFSLALLAHQLTTGGELSFSLPDTPLTGQRGEEDGEYVAPEPVQRREVRLYFAEPDGSGLTAERRRLHLGGEQTDNARRLLEALIEGPESGLAPIAPPSAEVRAVYLHGESELVVDFSRELLQDLPKSATSEALLVHGLVHTLTQSAAQEDGDASVDRLRLLVEGSSPHQSFSTHFDFDDPVRRDRDWESGQPAVDEGNV
ncbi:MAG: GerMN domain-containing protein [Candidatus Hydrogenedentota bacterium]